MGLTSAIFKLDELGRDLTHDFNNLTNTLFQVDCKFVRAFEYKGRIGTQSHSLTREVSSIMSFVQNDHIVGSLSLALSRADSLKICSQLMGEKVESLEDPRLQSMISEINNILHGSLKSQMVKQGIVCTATLPIILIGKTHNLFTTTQGKCFFYIFEILGCAVILELFLQD